MKNKKLKLFELDRIDMSEFKQRSKRPIILVLDNIRSAQNIGSMFRTGDAFLIEDMLL